MPLNFRPNGSAALDQNYEIDIRQPRIVPLENGRGAEFQYSFYVQGDRDGFAIEANISLDKTSGSQTTTLFLRKGRALDRILALKARLKITDSDYDFVADFSKGLLCVYEGGFDAFEPHQYFVVASEDIFDTLQIEKPHSNEISGTQRAVLADLFVPAYSDPESEPKI